MKSIILPTQPKWVEKILNSEKTIEVRKTAPKPPFKVYLYCTNIKSMNLNDYVNLHRATVGRIDDWQCKVVAEFICNKVEEIKCSSDSHEQYCERACLTKDDLIRYGNGKELKALHISNLKIYDTPKDLGEFRRLCKDYVNDYMNDCDDFCGYAENGLCCNGYIPVTRPPENYMYVEEL